MSAIAQTPVFSFDTARPPLTRLVRVEIRKMYDTRAGRWLLITLAAATAAIDIIVMFAGDASDLTFINFFTATASPQGVLLPILGILSVTSEWSQRTGLITFTLEPSRTRVVVAKLLASVALATAAVFVALAVAALANLLGVALQGGDGSWQLSVGALGDMVLAQWINVAQGVAFGMLIMNSAAAIVIYFVLPTAWSILVQSLSTFHTVAEWLDLGLTSEPLYDYTMTASAWVHLGTSAAVWLLLPLVLGHARLTRHEVK
jgi:ABC-2 type transport system permease protein